MPFNQDETTPLAQWIAGSREGDEESLNQLAEYLLPKAFEFANRKMFNLSPVDDYEDVAISAVKSICLRFRAGRTEFLGEKELSGLLHQFVIGKIRDRRKYHLAEKRNVNLEALEKRPSKIKDRSQTDRAVDDYAADPDSIWLDEQSISLPVQEQAYLEQMLDGLGTEIQGLFAELVKRLDDNPRKVLMLITTGAMSNSELARALDCAPTSIERYRRAIRRKIGEIVNE